MAAKFILTKGNKVIQQITLADVPMVIGRRPDTDIPIADPAVSGVHAKVQLIGDNYLIQDLNSTNGVHIGGRKIRQQVLKDGDVVVIGEHVLKFVQEGETAPADAKPAPPAAPRKTIEEISSDVTELRGAPGSAGGEKVPVLMVLNGADKDKLIKLDEPLTTIGTPGVQVAAISSRPQGHFIIHVDGGKDKDRVPLVNGEPTGFKSRKLEHGDKIEVAGIQMEYLAP